MKTPHGSSPRSAGIGIDGSEDELAMLARALGHPSSTAVTICA